MPSRRTILKAATLATTSSLLKSQEVPLPGNSGRANKGFNVARGISRRGEPMLLRGKDPTTIKVSGKDTEGQLVVFESTTSPGNGPGLHKHAHQDEWWYVLEGEFVFQVGDQKFCAIAGASVFGPRTVPHSFLSVGTIPGKMIITFQPAGTMEAFFEEFAKVTTAQPDAMVNGSVYGIDGLGPRVIADGVK
jgi:mannose-6-phosphate isomerase-like protein (cupin superfamily)